MKINSTGLSLIILGAGLIIFSIYFYHDLGVHEIRGTNPRYHWFFYGLYKALGKVPTCLVLAGIGIFMLVLGIKKLQNSQ